VSEINNRDAHTVFMDIIRIVVPNSDEEGYFLEHIELWLVASNQILSWVAGLSFISEFHSTLDNHEVKIHPLYAGFLNSHIMLAPYESVSFHSSQSNLVDSATASEYYWLCF